MKWVRAGAALAVAVAAAGCGVERTAVTAAGETSVRTITVDGMRRVYRLHVPKGLSGRSPLVVMMHGGLGSAKQAEESYGWDAQADKGRFVVAYPDGSDRAWNVGAGCCGKPGERKVDDVAFVSRMVADIRRTRSVDAKRIYATGMSNGGMMAYRLACDTGVFAAVAPVGATLLGACRDPRPVSVLHVHGLADERVRFDGAPGSGKVRIDGPPVRSVIGRWRAVDRCKAPSTTRSGPVTRERASCPGGRAVDLITIRGAGHQWPGGADPHPKVRELLDLDPPSKALDATAAIWRFFAAHPKR